MNVFNFHRLDLTCEHCSQSAVSHLSALSFCLIGLVSRIKKRCFRIIRKIPFVGATVSTSVKSVPLFLSDFYESLLDDFICNRVGRGRGGGEGETFNILSIMCS